jgi:hypothetical protein
VENPSGRGWRVERTSESATATSLPFRSCSAAAQAGEAEAQREGRRWTERVVGLWCSRERRRSSAREIERDQKIFGEGERESAGCPW